jgi:NTE family protein
MSDGSGPRPENHVLVLQGGGALGAYQAGAYEALAANGRAPGWLAGISIGAINAAIIAGNLPANRVDKLRQFWNLVSSGLSGAPILPGDKGRTLFNETSAWLASALGIPGFFSPRLVPPVFQAKGTLGALSYYDTFPLKETLSELIDFRLINNGGPRLSIGAVHIKTGNIIYFDSAAREIRVEHIMASGALPPGFPPVMVDGEAYWDGGLVSNTPLQFVLDNRATGDDMCIFQVDLFSARGSVPETIFDVSEREKEIRYSSRTRFSTSSARDLLRLRMAARRLAEKVPDALRDDPDLQLLTEKDGLGSVSIIHLIHRPNAYDTQSKDYEFSRLSMNEHWDAGLRDVEITFAHEDWKKHARSREGIAVYDLTCQLHDQEFAIAERKAR